MHTLAEDHICSCWLSLSWTSKPFNTLRHTPDRKWKEVNQFKHLAKIEVSAIFHILDIGRWFTPGGGGGNFPYILLNAFQTMFSQLAKRSARVLPADLCTDHAHYVKIHRSTVLRRNKNMAIEGGTVSHDYILVIRKFIDFMSLFRHSVWFSFSVKQFPSAEFGICNI